MRRALAAGIPAADIVYSGVGKKASELMEALQAGVGQINVESSAEIETLNAVAGQVGVKAVVTIRVNPDVDAGTHAKITTGRKENKFGIDIDLAREAFALAGRQPNLRVAGVAMHIGSQLTSLEPYRAAIVRVRELIGQLRTDGHHIDRFDLGGGRREADSRSSSLPALTVLLPGPAYCGSLLLISRICYIPTRNIPS
jgi:diaminopimelate decarboxylase